MPATQRVSATGRLWTKRLGTPALALVVLAFGSTAGCYRSPTDVTNYEPGVYKGTPDPLVKLSGQPEHEDALRQRFLTAATDR